MAYITVNDISLVFPLYARAQSHGVDPASLHDERVIRSPSGKILGVKALDRLSFHVASGERVALIGSNGSGKSTLLQILSGIISPDTGWVEVEGRATSLININLGMQMEATGHQNIALRGLASGHSRAEIESRRQQIAEFSELGEFLDMPIATYSAGMRMRLNFAIATAFAPEILLLDEWLSAGDAAFRQKASARMADFAGKAGILILASHSRKMIEDNCSTAIWLEGGVIQTIGPVDKVLSDYEAFSRETRRQKA